MLTRKLTIAKLDGFDVKTTTKIVNNASGFNSNITFIIDNNEADAKSMINLLALNPKYNQELTIKVEGNDEDEAMSQLINILNECEAI